jgi:Calcineurin-like phosphoesterase
MHLGILHLSDIHLTSDRNPVLSRVDQICAAVRSHSQEFTHLLLVYSGDIAGKGLKAEYWKAVELVAEIHENLSKMGHLVLLGPVIVPGNHDCDFSGDDDSRPALLQYSLAEIDKIDPAGKRVEQLCGVQNNFFEFETSISGRSLTGGSRLFWTNEIKASGLVLEVRCLNTAWFSRVKEQQGQLVFPVQCIPDKPSNTAHLCVTVFHHPYNWLESNNGKSLKKAIGAISDIILTGHEHEGAYYTTFSNTQNVNYIEGCALQDSLIPSAFNLISVDFEGRELNVTRYEWQNALYSPKDSFKTGFTRNRSILLHHLEFNPGYLAAISELGTGFIHLNRTHLTLDDLFVYPDLGIQDLTSDQDKVVALPLESVSHN